jgi:hypothetical protein
MCRIGKQLVQPAEHRRERSRDILVHDELTVVRAAVEAPVGDGEEPQLRERHGAARLPEPVLESGLDRRREGSDRRAVRLKRKEHERQGENL